MKADPVAADEPRTAAGRALLGASREMLRIGGTLSPATVNEMIQRIEAEAASPSAGDQVVDPTIGDMQRALAKAMGCPLDDTYPICSHGGDAWEYARHLIRDGLVITPLQDSHEAELGKPRDAVAEGHQDARELDWDTRAQEQKDYTPGPSELVDYGD